jgi:hypothetical protein
MYATDAAGRVGRRRRAVQRIRPGGVRPGTARDRALPFFVGLANRQGKLRAPMTLTKTLFAALALLLTAIPAWSQSAEALAAREVTEAEQAYVAEHFADAVDIEVEAMMARIGELTPRLHVAFPQTLHTEIDTIMAAYFESQRPRVRDMMMRAIAESMTLEEMRGIGLNTARSLEIRQSIFAELEPHARQLGIDAVRHLCSIVQDRAPQECRPMLERADEMEALSAN